MSSRTGAELRTRRHSRVRKKVAGTTERPRLAVFRSNKHVVAQVIDDSTGKTLAAASSLADVKGKSTSNIEAATSVGTLVAERAKGCRHQRSRLRPWRFLVPRPRCGHR